MYCPRCRHEIKNEKARFCPKCGFDIPSFPEIVKERFSSENRRKYNLVIAIAFILSIAGFVMYFFIKHLYFYVALSVLSWSMIYLLSKKIGLIDRMNIEEDLKKYLTFTSVFVSIARIFNLVTMVLFVISLFNI